MNKSSKLFTLLFIAVFALGCTSTKSTVENEETTPGETETVSAEVAVVKATETWHLAPANANPYYGTGVEKAYEELISDKTPKQKVIVAIIDSGTDINHEDLKNNIWVNDDEIPGNEKDDDENGYVDDIYGWNFIGGPDSSHVDYDTYEVTRLYASLNKKFGDMEPNDVPDENIEEYNYYHEIKEAYERRVQENEQQIMQVHQFKQTITAIKQILNITNIDSLSNEDMEITEDDNPQVMQAKQILVNVKTNGLTEEDIKGVDEFLDHAISLADYGLNPEFDPRHIVGDDYEDLKNRYYGNNDVTGPRNDHGTHVAGIVGAVRENNLGALGIASNVELMILRTVPDGDERDKDVANSIRYAAENGAKVINMSFGKGYSPEKHYVDAAIRFADSLGVLMISGSGNDSDNIDSTDSFPTKFYENGGFATNYLSVGASSWQSDSTLAADFSNYGKKTVDLFAPGVQVYSTFPDDAYKMNSGTSMASPVVAGVAALIMSYYPELTVTEVKEIILETVTKIDQTVFKPGTHSKVPFSELSVSGGIVNAYEALKLAEERSNQ